MHQRLKTHEAKTNWPERRNEIPQLQLETPNNEKNY